MSLLFLLSLNIVNFNDNNFTTQSLDDRNWRLLKYTDALATRYFCVEDTRLETSQQTFNYSPPTGGNFGTASYYYIVLKREVISADLRKQQLTQMPGFQVTWRYSGMEVKSWDFYKNSLKTMAFIRNCSNNNYSNLFFLPINNIFTQTTNYYNIL